MPSLAVVGLKLLVVAVEVKLPDALEQTLIVAVEETLTALRFGLVSPFVPEKECC